MLVKKYLGKLDDTCEMCGDMSYSDKYNCIGHITKCSLTICTKCAKRETGGKSWPKKSQQLKKL